MTLSANTISLNKLNIIHQDDIVSIESCDKFGWCKISNKSLYVRKFKFKSLDGVLHIMTSTKNAYYYKKTFNKRSLYGYNKNLLPKVIPSSNNVIVKSKIQKEPIVTKIINKNKENIYKKNTLPNAIYLGDIVYVEYCNITNWCKVKNKDLYINKLKFSSFDGIIYVMIDSGNTYYYKKNKNDFDNRYVIDTMVNSIVNKHNFIVQEKTIKFWYKI